MKIITALLFTAVLSIGSASADTKANFDEGRLDMPIRFEIMNEFLKGNPPSVNELKILHKQHARLKHSFAYRAGGCLQLLSLQDKMSHGAFQTITTLETNFERGPMVTIMERDDNLTVEDIQSYYNRCFDTLDVFFEIVGD